MEVVLIRYQHSNIRWMDISTDRMIRDKTNYIPILFQPPPTQLPNPATPPLHLTNLHLPKPPTPPNTPHPSQIRIPAHPPAHLPPIPRRQFHHQPLRPPLRQIRQLGALLHTIRLPDRAQQLLDRVVPVARELEPEVLVARGGAARRQRDAHGDWLEEDVRRAVAG